MKYTREDVASRLGISIIQLFRWVRDGKFAASDIRESGRTYWSARLLDRELRRINGARRAKLRAQLAALSDTP